MTESSLSLARLRRRLERIEPRREATPAGLFGCGHEGVDGWLGGGLARGRLHEVFADEAGEASAGAGFAALLGLQAGSGRPLFWLRTEAVERQAGRLYATGLEELGIAPAALLLGLVADETALLRAANDAARCAGLGALIVECWGSARMLDLTASRRLMLAAEASGVTILLLRVAAQAAPSAADTRWRVAAAPSRPLEADAPGHPTFDIELLRRRAGPAGQTWRVEWDRDRLAFQDPGALFVEEAPLSGAGLSVAADRAAADHEAAPLRHRA